MKKINKLTVIIVLALIISISSCDKMYKYDGSRPYIEKFLGEEALINIESQNFPIYYGGTPPNIEGDYVASTHTVIASTVPQDQGTVPFDLVDFEFHFNNQNEKKLTVDFEAEEGIDIFSILLGEDFEYIKHKGKGTYISGHDNYFTVFMKTEVKTKLFGKAIVAKVLSGKITSQGVADYQITNYMLEIKSKDPIMEWIPENTGRIAIDSDNIAMNL